MAVRRKRQLMTIKQWLWCIIIIIIKIIYIAPIPAGRALGALQGYIHCIHTNISFNLAKTTYKIIKTHIKNTLDSKRKISVTQILLK